MNGMDCDSVVDLLPDRLTDRVDELSRARIDEHLAECAECRSMREILLGVRRSRAQVPAGLHERVLNALISRPPARHWPAARLALAATVVFALVTASLLWPGSNRFGRGTVVRSDPPSVNSDLSMNAPDPLLVSDPGLAQLSLDELERLLAELDS